MLYQENLNAEAVAKTIFLSKQLREAAPEAMLRLVGEMTRYNPSCVISSKIAAKDVHFCLSVAMSDTADTIMKFIDGVDEYWRRHGYGTWSDKVTRSVN